ncbi:MAG: hypothetical protein ACOZAM_09280 [Pseudomonadota bacterium]|jgi:hypothetical protein
MTQGLERTATSTGKFSSRRAVIGWLVASAGLSILPRAGFASQDDVARRFEFLSNKGNSSCSRAFLDSIPSMPDAARLQGSCCAPMVLHRYREQVAGLEAYATIAEIPPDPYDIEAGLAKRLLAAYDLDLTPDQQEAYDQAMVLSSEKGPCCCQCWRWHVYGGLGRSLIRDRGFSGEKVARIWNLSDGCGGEDHMH